MQRYTSPRTDMQQGGHLSKLAALDSKNLIVGQLRLLSSHYISRSQGFVVVVVIVVADVVVVVVVVRSST